jgi:allantoin racemase
MGRKNEPFPDQQRQKEARMGKIVMLTPFPDSSPLTLFSKKEFKHVTDMTVVGLDSGLEIITSYYHIEYHMGPLLDKALQIEQSGGCDALIVGCFGDPGLFAIRQITSMPVIGTGQTSLCVAAMAGDKIGIVVPQKDFVYITEKMIHAYQFTDHVVAIRSADDFVPESILARPEEAVLKMASLCLQLIREKDADVLIFGCIGFSWMIERIRDILAREGFTTPIIEPGITAYRAARLMADLKLNQDRRKLKMD